MAITKLAGYIHHYYIHDVFGSMVRSMAVFLKNDLYPQSTEVVIGTYEKAIQHYKDFKEQGTHKFTSSPPFISLDPNLDFAPDEIAGRFQYMYPNLAFRQGGNNFGPDIYYDGNVKISPVLNYYKGSFEIIVWCRTVYEYIDYRFLTFQFCGGTDRTIYPFNCEINMVIPDYLKYYTHDNPYTAETYPLDWENNRAKAVLYKTLNLNKFIFPFTLRPYLKFVNIGDASEKYGGDDFSSYRLLITVEWETQFPMYLYIEDNLSPNISNFILDIDIGSYYANAEGLIAPKDIVQTRFGDEEGEVFREDWTASGRATYIITEEDINNLDNDVDLEITLPEVVNIKNIRVYHPDRELKKFYEYDVDGDSVILILKYAHLKELIKINDLITIVLYQKTE
jgi:hypothetical protein